MKDYNEIYYVNSYYKTQREGVQGWGNSLIDRQIEKFGNFRTRQRVLEIGGASGEHIKYLRNYPDPGMYYCIDLQPGMTNATLYSFHKSRGVIFRKGNAERLPFDTNFFSRSVSTCVLAHVADPESVFLELRRATQNGGSIVIGMPCDPGVVNRLVKFFVTYRTLKKNGVDNPKLSYAREHRNGIWNLIQIAKNVYKQDTVKFHFFPFRLPSWNLNLAVILEVTVRK